MSARYFMDLPEVFAAGYSVSDVKTTLGEYDAGGSFTGLQQWSGDIYYFTIDFTGTAIHPGDWNLYEKEAVLQITSPVQGGMSNDWSYKEITTNHDYDCKTFPGKSLRFPY